MRLLHRNSSVLYMSLQRLPMLLLFHKQPRTTRPGLLASHISVSCAQCFAWCHKTNFKWLHIGRRMGSEINNGNIYSNNCPTRCNTKQSIYYSASSIYMFRVSITPIIRSTQNWNYSLRYWSYFLCSCLPPTWPSYTHHQEYTKL